MKPAQEIAAEVVRMNRYGVRTPSDSAVLENAIARAIEAARVEAFECAAGVIDSELSDLEDITDMPSMEKMIVRSWLMNARARIRARAGERNI